MLGSRRQRRRDVFRQCCHFDMAAYFRGELTDLGYAEERVRASVASSGWSAP